MSKQYIGGGVTVERSRGIIVLTTQGDEETENTIYLEPEVWWWATEWYVAERLTYVHPDHRSGQQVASLIKFARSFVDNMSAQLGYRVFLIGSVVATKDARTKTALFGRMLNFAGGVFAYPDPAVPRLLN